MAEIDKLPKQSRRYRWVYRPNNMLRRLKTQVGILGCN